VQNQYIVRPHGWLDKIALAEAHGRKVVRTELTPQQSLGIIGRLKAPFDTFVLLLACLGRRSEEAAALQPHDLDDDCVLHFVVSKLKCPLFVASEMSGFVNLP
jgi:hypothetical protein